MLYIAENCILYLTLLLALNVNAMGLNFMQTVFLLFSLKKAPNVIETAQYTEVNISTC